MDIIQVLKVLITVLLVLEIPLVETLLKNILMLVLTLD